MSIDIFRTRPRNDQPVANENGANGIFGQDAGIPEFVDLDNLTQNNGTVFTDPIQEEVDDLARAMTTDGATYVDNQGAIHLEGAADGENMTKVDGNVFGAPSVDDEISQLAGAMANDEAGDGYFVDEFGRITLTGEAGPGVNLTKVDGNVFGAPSVDDEISQLAGAMANDEAGDGYFVDEFGRITLTGEAGPGVNLTKVDGNVFGTPSVDDEIAQLAGAMANDQTGDGYFVDEFGRITLSGEAGAGTNLTKVDGNIFGAHEDQWYNKNPQLARAEIATMRKHYSNAGYKFLAANGNMYWIVTIQVFQNAGITKPWKFMLVYDKDHPHNHGFGGSIKVVPLSPSLDDLQRIAAQRGRPGVPHVISNPSHFLKKYLCTRWPKDIESGDELVSSATQAAAWAADWAAHFEVGIRDACVWNKWCDDSHFRHMQVTCRKKDCPRRTCPYGKRG